MNPMFRRHLQIILCLAMLAPAARLWAQDVKDEKPERKFLRFVDDNDGGGKLQTAIVTYKNANGVTIHLVGAVHVGEQVYYDGLSKTFEGYDALLYEMVKPKNMVVPGEGVRSNSMLSMFQRLLKDVLELQFQLDAIDYHAKNFVHADLDAETFAKLQAERGENIFTLMLRQILNEMNNPKERNAPEVTLPELLVALTSPDRARHFKLILARQFEDLDRQVEGLSGPGGSVLVDERDKAAIRVLKDQIALGKKNLGIFYGAAHMPDLEKRIEALGFKPVSTEWRTAWDMTPQEGDIIVKTVKKTPTTRP